MNNLDLHKDYTDRAATREEICLMRALGIARQLRDDPLLPEEKEALLNKLVETLVSGIIDGSPVPF